MIKKSLKNKKEKTRLTFKVPNLSRKKLQNTSLSKKELSIILGGLLGDGSLKIYPGYKNARYSFRHSITQKNYFLYKANQLKNLGSPKSIQLQKPDGWSQKEKLRFCTRATLSLTEIHSITHHLNKIKVQRRWLNHLTSESLAIWWFDDGSIVGGGRQGCICTDGFSLAENQILLKYLKTVWNITGRCHPVKNQSKRKLISNFSGEKTFTGSVSECSRVLEDFKERGEFYVYRSRSSLYVKRRPCNFRVPSFLEEKKYYRLFFSTEETKKFLTIIIPHCPHEDLLYKCFLKYKSVQLQERWISHMKSLLPETFHNSLRK